LAENGIVILGDVVPPHVSAWTDAVALIRFGAANGFLGATFVGLARTLVSDYWRLRFDLGLSRYSEAAMIATLAAGGCLAAARPPRQYRPQPRAHDLHRAADVSNARHPASPFYPLF